RDEPILLGDQRRLLLLQSGLLLAERRLLLPQRGRLALERRLLALEPGLLTLQRGRLLLQLLLLLLQVLLEARRLVVLLGVLGARLGGRPAGGRDQQRPVVSGPEPRGHQVVGLPLRRRRGVRCIVLLAELKREQWDGQGNEDGERGSGGDERVARHQACPL